jgi:anti-sigma factor RsiW
MNCPYYEHVTEAYLSGQIEDPDWCTHLQTCIDCAAKLREESDFDVVIKHAINEERLQTRQLEAHVRAAIRESSPWHRPLLLIRYGIAASVVFATLLIASIGYAKGRMDRTAVCLDAVDDHQEEIIGKAPRKWRSDSSDVQSLSQRAVGDPSLPQRIVPAGYHLVGARICDLHGKRYMHLDYSDGEKEISFFVRHQDEHKTLASRVLGWFEPSASGVERVDGLTVGSVQKKNLSLVLVSASPIDDVQKVVTEAAKQL